MNRRQLLLLLAACVGLWSCATSSPPPPAYPQQQPQSPPPVTAPQPVPHRPPIAQPQPVLVGTVTHVVDGDTIHVQLSSGPIKVRLGSIDTPEWNQPWGAESRAALQRRLDGRQVSLDVVEQDRYGRLVAIVYVGEVNVNAWMVQQGNAWAYRQYMEDVNYCAWEGVARATRLGLWSLPANEIHAPWEWRAVERHEATGYSDYSHESVANCIASMHRGPAK
jgi:micrococcal nuclease